MLYIQNRFRPNRFFFHIVLRTFLGILYLLKFILPLEISFSKLIDSVVNKYLIDVPSDSEGG